MVSKNSIMYPIGIGVFFMIDYFFLIFIPFIGKQDMSFLIKVFLIVLHIVLFFVVWCFVILYNSNAGVPPPFWGFYLNDTEQKKKRYCLICHVFKPERCHHCSTCNKCVLVMDHHCPWLNGCIGFLNRKYFMMLLFYTIISLLLIVISNFYYVFDFFKNKKMWYILDGPYYISSLV